MSEQDQQQDGEGLREVSGEGVVAEEFEADGDEPVGQRGLFEVSDAIDVEGNEVAGGGHGACGLRVGGIRVIEQTAERRGRRKRSRTIIRPG